MEKKQSSIDWLVEQLEAQGFLYDLDIEQAKAMHKEEITTAYVQAEEYHSKSLTKGMMKDNADYYYSETFGGDNE